MGGDMWFEVQDKISWGGLLVILVLVGLIEVVKWGSWWILSSLGLGLGIWMCVRAWLCHASPTPGEVDLRETSKPRVE